MRTNARVLIVTGAGALALAGAAATVGAAQEGQNAGAESSRARTVWSGVYSQAQADRGGAVYASSCANCHGAALEGADMSPALAGAAFMASWNDLTLGDLFERIRISMPADRPGTLSRQDMSDVIAHVLRVNRFPAGTSELPTETPALKAIAFVAAAPADPTVK